MVKRTLLGGTKIFISRGDERGLQCESCAAPLTQWGEYMEMDVCVRNGETIVVRICGTCLCRAEDLRHRARVCG